jgi:hypothetical protein
LEYVPEKFAEKVQAHILSRGTFWFGADDDESLN